VTPEQIAERCKVLSDEIEILEREVDDPYVAGYFGAAVCALAAAHDYLTEPEEGGEDESPD
jgi:hypothetical protein